MSIGLLPKDIWISIIIPSDIFDLLSLHRVNRFFRNIIDYDQNFFLRHIEFRYTEKKLFYESKVELRWLAWSDLQKDIFCMKNYPSVSCWFLDRPYFEPTYVAFKCLVKTGNIKDAKRLLKHPKTPANVSHHWIGIIFRYDALELVGPLLSLGISGCQLWELHNLLEGCWDAGLFDALDIIFDNYIPNLERLSEIISLWPNDIQTKNLKEYYLGRTVSKKRKIDEE